MKEEFPQLEEWEYQKEFLADWWSPKKLFVGGRQSGKTTMMLCEARRFHDKEFNVLFLTETMPMANMQADKYHQMFGERPLFEMGSYHQVRNGTLRGGQTDVVVCDEFQRIDLETFNQEVMPMMPMFIRASACKTAMQPVHYLLDQEDGDFFDSVYEY